MSDKDHAQLKKVLIGRKANTPLGEHTINDVDVNEETIWIEIQGMFRYDLEECTIMDIPHPVTDRLKDAVKDLEVDIKRIQEEIEQ